MSRVEKNGAMKPDENGNIKQSNFSVHWMYKYYQNLISSWEECNCHSNQ